MVLSINGDSNHVHLILVYQKKIPISFEEYQKFCSFTASLLSRSSKLSELVGQLESELGDKDEKSTEGKRVAKP